MSSSRAQCNDSDDARTRDSSVSSQELYHLATANYVSAPVQKFLIANNVIAPHASLDKTIKMMYNAPKTSKDTRQHNNPNPIGIRVYSEGTDN